MSKPTILALTRIQVDCCSALHRMWCTCVTIIVLLNINWTRIFSFQTIFLSPTYSFVFAFPAFPFPPHHKVVYCVVVSSCFLVFFFSVFVLSQLYIVLLMRGPKFKLCLSGVLLYGNRLFSFMHSNKLIYILLFAQSLSWQSICLYCITHDCIDLPCRNNKWNEMKQLKGLHDDHCG